MKSLLLIGYQQICHCFCHLSLKKALWNGFQEVVIQIHAVINVIFMKCLICYILQCQDIWRCEDFMAHWKLGKINILILQSHMTVSSGGGGGAVTSWRTSCKNTCNLQYYSKLSCYYWCMFRFCNVLCFMFYVLCFMFYVVNVWIL